MTALRYLLPWAVRVKFHASDAYQLAIFLPLKRVRRFFLSILSRRISVSPINKRLLASPVPFGGPRVRSSTLFPSSIQLALLPSEFYSDFRYAVEDRRWLAGRSVPWRGNANFAHAARWIIILSPVTAIRYGKISWKLIYFNALLGPGRGCSWETSRRK